MAEFIRYLSLADSSFPGSWCAGTIAVLYNVTSQYTAAEPLLHQAAEIVRACLGDGHPTYAASLNNLAELYRSMGNYAAAEPLFQRMIEILRSALGEDHTDYATGLNNLADLYSDMGNYAAAEPMYRRTLEIVRATYGEDHPDFAGSLNNLAELYRLMGNHYTAEQFLRQALSIFRRTLREAHPLVANCLNNLAGVCAITGNPEAELLYLQALDLTRRSLGDGHPHIATSLNNIANFYSALGNYVAAERLHQQALEIRRQTLGIDHPLYAASLYNLGAIYQRKGNHTAAEPLYGQALQILHNTLGDNHPDYANCLENLAKLYITTDRLAEAITLMQQAISIDNQMIEQVFSIGSERQRMAYLRTIEVNFDTFLSMVSLHFSQSPDATCAAFDLVLRRKAIGAEALAAQRDTILGGKYPALVPKLQKLTTIRLQIAQKTLAGPGPEGLSTHRQLLAEWNSQKEELETELARQMPEKNLERKLQAADRQAIALALPEGTTLIEFVRFNEINFKAVPASDESHLSLSRYLVFVLPAGQPDKFRMINLGDAEPIDRMISAFLAAIQDLRAFRVEAASDSSNCNGTALRVAIFDKLLPALGNCKRLLLSPDGDLTRLPFEVLPTDNNQLLIDDYQISYVSTGRDVLRFGAPSSVKPTEPLVAADPDFDLDATVGGESLNSSKLLGRRSRDLERIGAHFKRLPGTRVEGERIARMLKVKPLLEGAVLESRIKDCRSPRILHLATHGFFLQDQPRNPNQEWQDLGAVAWQTTSGWERLLGAELENPLLRSGLALAGANTWLNKGELPAEAEDGILTAEDVSGLDLLATELVVLSACETGLGEIRTGEGVFGLRRAFMLAGAKTLVMSLWEVPDKQTQELMVEFYRQILKGQPRAGALRAAQLKMKAKYPDPFYWGAFICQGDSTPLPA